MHKMSYIRKTRNKEEWCVYSQKGKNLGCYPSRDLAEKRLNQIEYFKHQRESSTLIRDLRYLAEELNKWI